MRNRPRTGAAVTAIAAVALSLASCTSGDDSAAGQAVARHSRSQTTAASLALARRFISGGLGPVSGPGGGHSARGQYLICPPARGNGLYYDTGFAAADVPEATGRSAAFRQRVASVLTSTGWKLTPMSTPTHEEPFGFAAAKGSLSGMTLASLRTGNVIEVLVIVDSGCFAPGPAAASLQHRKPDTIALPG